MLSATRYTVAIQNWNWRLQESLFFKSAKNGTASANLTDTFIAEDKRGFLGGGRPQMPSCICRNKSSEGSFHFPVQIALGRRNYLTSFFSFGMYLRRTGISHSSEHRIDCTGEGRHTAVHVN